jgi:hypothetical protein
MPPKIAVVVSAHSADFVWRAGVAIALYANPGGTWWWSAYLLESEENPQSCGARPAEPLANTGGKEVLLLSLVLAGSTAVSSGLQLWQRLIIKSYGLTNMQTDLLNSIPFALASIVMILWGKRSDQKSEWTWHASLPLIIAALSLVSALPFHSLFAVLVILCLANIGIYAGKGPAWALSIEWLRRVLRLPAWGRSVPSAILPGSALPTCLDISRTRQEVIRWHCFRWLVWRARRSCL